ncbi:uncharacterized protein LOC133177189 isoform X4 [Saccostrea echinata]|uniref:uncharacterized protein LOC133177189 isoform X4 n=1 Tax=Saccostrea echinata TaxID=191078 RepID=UPI002A825BF5|nr:uncharacterized protein LOC133177189 isoform X4 [Saccostrea echinata]
MKFRNPSKMDEIQLQNMKANGTDTENVQKHRFKKVEKKANHTLLILMGGLTFALVSLGISIPLLICSKKMADSKSSQQHLDYGTLKKVMLDSLTHSFTSDVITSSGTVSDRWNKFFIKYDCCAVNQVISTTNDFDTTPWCTTSGSCQQTNSQIPKTCCKDVTEHDYVNATDSCHATVNTGSYKDSCFSRVKKLSDNTSIQEYQIDAIINLSFILALMAIVAILQVIVMTVHCFLSLHEK